jgi:nucleotide-binding universal stress UspA family protein
MRILLATDGSAHSQAASELLRRLHPPAGSELTLLTVIERVRPFLADEHPILGQHLEAAFEQLREELQHGAAQLLEHETARLAGSPLRLETRAREGDPADQILRAGRELNADLVVLGSRGLGPIRGLLIGSVSRRVVRRCEQSILLVRIANAPVALEAGPPPLRVLLAYDGSAHAQRACLLLEQLLSGGPWSATILLVVPELVGYGLNPTAQRLLAEVHRAEREAGAAVVAQVAERLRARGAQAQARVVDGDPATEIGAVARELGVDLLAVGLEGRGAMDRILIGSVADQLLREAPCSLLLAR